MRGSRWRLNLLLDRLRNERSRDVFMERVPGLMPARDIAAERWSARSCLMSGRSARGESRRADSRSDPAALNGLVVCFADGLGGRRDVARRAGLWVDAEAVVHVAGDLVLSHELSELDGPVGEV